MRESVIYTNLKGGECHFVHSLGFLFYFILIKISFEKSRVDLFVTFIETSRGVSLVKNLGGVVLINLKGDCCNLLSLSLSLSFLVRYKHMLHIVGFELMTLPFTIHMKGGCAI